MNNTQLPICPTLRAAAIALNRIRRRFDLQDKFGFTFVREALDLAKSIPSGDAEAVFRTVLAGKDAVHRTTRVPSAPLLALAIMRVHQVRIQSETSGETLGVCQDCGGLVLHRPKGHRRTRDVARRNCPGAGCSR